VDAGADFITTQLFFDNQAFFKFVSDCKKAGISIPILPGLLPALSLGQVKRFCSMCEARLPPELEHDLQQSEESDQPEIGADWALDQVKELLNGGCPGFHLYALNKSKSTLKILEGLGRKQS
jgi:methylenetetrahydrofolate reductase (NADPH)